MNSERIPIRRLHPPTLAEQWTARLLAREQQKGEKARQVCSAARTRRNTAAPRERRKGEAKEAAEDEGSTLQE